MVNEIKRRVQILRKDAQLVEKDKIKLTINTEKEIEAIMKKHEKRIAGEVNASSVGYSPGTDLKEYKIDGRIVKLGVQKTI